MEKKELTGGQVKAVVAAIKDFAQFRIALTKESDRGCVLFAAAYLDKALSQLLKAHLVQSPKVDDELFNGQNALSSFSSRIKMAYYLGKIAVAERKDLDTIRNIRNDFAHNAEPLDFTNQSIAMRCGNLTNSWREPDATPRQKFTAAVSGLMVHISHATRTAVAFPEAPDSRLPQEIFDAARAYHAELSEVARENGEGKDG